MEHLGAMGVHLFAKTAKKWPMPKKRAEFEKMSTNDQKFIAGNGFHMQTMGSWMIYIVSNIKRIGADS